MREARVVLLHDGSYVAVAMRICLILEGFKPEDITEVRGTEPEITIFEGKEKSESKILAHINTKDFLENVRSQIRTATTSESHAT